MPRYKRRQAPPGDAGHGLKSSVHVSALSNHPFRSAFDIDVAGNQRGVFRGGHFGDPLDGVHFGISQV